MTMPSLAEADSPIQENLEKAQRKSCRHTYHCRQLVAPYDGCRMPRQDEFDWAMFNDISSTGISFLAAEKPASKQLIVAVGPAPFNFLVVEIVRTFQRDDLENCPYHIGCRVLRELDE